MDMLAVMSPAAARTEQTRIAIEGRQGCATVGERVVWLTRREAQLLDYLVARRGAVVRREELQLRIWGAIIPGHQDRSLDAYVLRLNQKLGAVAPGATFIHTHHATGYRLEPTVSREERS